MIIKSKSYIFEGWCCLSHKFGFLLLEEDVIIEPTLFFTRVSSWITLESYLLMVFLNNEKGWNDWYLGYRFSYLGLKRDFQ